MKRLIGFFAMMAIVTSSLFADEVLPSVNKEEMSAYKEAFGKAIAESKKAQAEAPRERKDNFGAKVSEAAKNTKEEILKTEKNFGAWVSSQRRNEKSQKERDQNPSSGVRDSLPGGHPNQGHGKPESAGHSGQGHGNPHKN